MTSTVEVKFTNKPYDEKTYHYLTDLVVNEGEKVVVDSPSDGYVTVKITKVYVGECSKRATKYVVCKIDDKEYLARIEKDKLKAKIVAKLEDKKKQIEEEAIWKYLADQDPEAAALFKELKSLG